MVTVIQLITGGIITGEVDKSEDGTGVYPV
jgi:hypothetical protein